MRAAIALVLTSLLLAGCGQQAPSAGGGLGPEDLTPEERQAFVYAAVIRHMTSEEGQASGFDVIYVLDHAVEGAGDPETDEGEGTAISQVVQDRVREELALLGRIEFVPDRDEVIGPQADGAQVRNGGILITLGPVPSGDERVEVEASSYLSNLAGTWQTWVLERHGLRWQVTGTTGPVAIS